MHGQWKKTSNRGTHDTGIKKKRNRMALLVFVFIGKTNSCYFCFCDWSRKHDHACFQCLPL